MKRRWSLRVRLTVVFGLLFFAAGAAVLGVTYLLVKQTLDAQTPSTGIDKEALLAKEKGADVTAALAAAAEQQRLLEQAWDEHTDPFTNTVRVAIMTLRRKLGDPPLIHTVSRVGYRLGS